MLKMRGKNDLKVEQICKSYMERDENDETSATARELVMFVNKTRNRLMKLTKAIFGD